MSDGKTHAAEVERLADVLLQAQRERTAIAPLSSLVPGGLDLELGHAVCERNVATRLQGGEVLAGFKVGFTNLAARERLGLPDSMYGYILDSMVVTSGGELRMEDFLAPRIETEICFRLGKELRGSDLTVDDVLDATEAVTASFEICDARIRGWQCPYPDFFADNGFAARIVVSDRWVPVSEVDLPAETVGLRKDGELIAEGAGEMSFGHPARAVAWLVGSLSARGRSLTPGTLVMSGTLTPMLPIVQGASYVGSFSTLGLVEMTFV